MIGLFVSLAKAIVWLYPWPVAAIYQLLAMPITVLSLFDAEIEVSKFRRISLMLLRLAAVGLTIASLSAVIQFAIMLLGNPSLLVVMLKMRILAPLWFITGLLFFCLKRFQPVVYGSFELFVGALSILFAISKYSEDLQAEVIALLGGIYIIVRGCDNVDRGLKPEWKAAAADIIARYASSLNENFFNIG